MRVFLDANIIFSAAQAGSATRELLEGVHRYGELVTNLHAWTEALRNLARKRPSLVPGLEELREIIGFSNAFQPIKDIDLPQEDIPILAGAIGSRCTHLWTSDKRHFGKWYGRTVGKVTIVSSPMLADLVMELGWEP